MTETVPAAASRGHYLIRGATVVTVDPDLGDVADGDVHVRDGVIEAVGRDLPVPPGAELIDAAGMIAVPGFVDTHWHMWTSPWRGAAVPRDRGGDNDDRPALPAVDHVSRHCLAGGERSVEVRPEPPVPRVEVHLSRNGAADAIPALADRQSMAPARPRV